MLYSKKYFLFKSLLSGVFFYLRISKLKICLIISILILCFTNSSYGFIRDGSISGRKGLSFSSISYQFKELYVTVRNRNHNNVNFGGTMIFLDRHYRETARAVILRSKIKRNSSRRFNARFIKGSGNEASSASYLVWEF